MTFAERVLKEKEHEQIVLSWWNYRFPSIKRQIVIDELDNHIDSIRSMIYEKDSVRKKQKTEGCY